MVALAFAPNGTTAVLQRRMRHRAAATAFPGLCLFYGSAVLSCELGGETGVKKRKMCGGCRGFRSSQGEMAQKYLMAAIIITVVSGVAAALWGNMVLGKLSVRMDAAVLYLL